MARTPRSRKGKRPPLKGTRGLTLALLGLLAVLAALSLWDAKMTLEARPIDGNFSPLNPMTWSPWTWSVFLLAVLTPIWLARVHRNAETLSGSSIRGSPAWTAGIWFVPFLGGFFAASALRQVWERSGARTLPPRAWAILWSLAQFIVVVELIAAMPSYFDAHGPLGDPPYTAEEEAVLDEVLRQHIWGFVFVLDLLTVLAAVCMGIAVLDLDRVQGEPPGSTHTAVV